MAAPKPPAPVMMTAAAALLLVALLLACAAPSRAARVPDLFAGVLRDAAADAAAAAQTAAQTAVQTARAGASLGPGGGDAAAAAPSTHGRAPPDDPAPSNPLPVVMWHGMGDSCCALGSIGGVAKFVESRLGAYVHSIATGEGELRDVASSFYGNVNDQVAQVCEELTTSADLARELSGGFNMVGFSQGGQFLRAVVQRCGHELPGPVHALITLGAQHAGVSNAPACAGATAGGGGGAAACAAVQTALAAGAYSPWVRDHVVQAQYFKAPGNIEEYLKRNVFLPDINNELAPDEDEGEDEKKSGGGGSSSTASLYKKNLQSLERLVLFKFQNDSIVEPSDSSFFGFWGEDGTPDEGKIVPLRDTRLYKEDLLGLRALDERGALVFDLVPDADHMQFSMRWFEESVMDAFLARAPERGWLERARGAQREKAAAAP